VKEIYGKTLQNRDILMKELYVYTNRMTWN